MSFLGANAFGSAITSAIVPVLLRPKRGFQPPTVYSNIDDATGLAETAVVPALISMDAVIEEQGDDQLEITDHPVEQGAVISDHAYKRPAEVTITGQWAPIPPPYGQNSGLDFNYLQSTYTLMLNLQNSRNPLTIYTGKRVYANMLLRVISVLTDKNNENILQMRITCREVLLTTTQTVANTPATLQALASQTSAPVPQGTQNLLPATNLNVPALPVGVP